MLRNGKYKSAYTIIRVRCSRTPRAGMDGVYNVIIDIQNLTQIINYNIYILRIL